MYWKEKYKCTNVLKITEIENWKLNFNQNSVLTE